MTLKEEQARYAEYVKTENIEGIMRHPKAEARQQFREEEGMLSGGIDRFPNDSDEEFDFKNSRL